MSRKRSLERSNAFELQLNDVLCELFDENQRLLCELKFTQNVYNLCENLRNLLKLCLNECQNCGKNVEILEKFNALSVDLNECNERLVKTVNASEDNGLTHDCKAKNCEISFEEMVKTENNSELNARIDTKSGEIDCNSNVETAIERVEDRQQSRGRQMITIIDCLINY